MEIPMSGADEIPRVLERYRGEDRRERGYPDLHDHVLALHRAGLLIIVEPGTLNGFQRILKCRDALIGENAKIEFRANFYNLFNKLNLFNPQTNILDPHFGEAQNALGSRTIELQARFSF